MLALTFQVGPDTVGLDIGRVLEVIPRVRLRPLTGSPPWMAGVFVYHGQVVPVIDLPKMAGFGECPSHLSSRIILIPLGLERLVGLLATQVADLRDVPDATSSLPSPAAGGLDLGPVVADNGGVLRVLDPDRLLPPDARELILAAGGPA